MPRNSMTWDAAADAKLFALIIQLLEIKIGGQNLARLNVAMGLDPKSQSISHRIGTLKKTVSLPEAGASLTSDIKPLTPRGPKKTSPKKRKDSPLAEDDEYAEEAKPEAVEELSTEEHTPFYEGGTKKRKPSSSPGIARAKFTKKLRGEKGDSIKEEDAEFDPYDVSADSDLLV